MATVDMTAHPADSAVDAAPVTSLESLADELRLLDPGTVKLQVDARPAFSVAYSLRLEGQQLAAWRRAARDTNLPDEPVDEFLWQRIILAAQCKGIFRSDKQVTDTSGKPVDFRSPELWSLLGVPAGSPDGAQMAVRYFYGSNDFAITAAADKLMVKAGFGKEASEVTPTPGLSDT